MNILVPETWLAEYLETKMTPEEMAALVSKFGPSFERIYEVEGEKVHDIEITTNRVDAMSIKGLAREIAAIAGDKVKPKKLKEKLVYHQKVETKALPLPEIKVETPAVKKIMCVVLDEVKNVASPEWIQKRLRQIDQNSHGIIIDMSNYVTHELGHPCHTFDYDKIMALGGKIIVKQAAKGKKFVTLDGEEHETVGGEVVFENEAGEIIDLPAIKGTANTAIDKNTTRVLFWLENMDAATVRRASMSHAIRTVAAILNEKNVDPALAEEVLTLGVDILRREASAKVASEVFVYESESCHAQIPEIKLDLARLNSYLGVEIAPERVKKILTDLEFTVKQKDKQTLLVTPPSFRTHDVTMEADLIEEVARIYGYHNLPSRLDFPTVQIPPQEQFNFALETRLKHLLVDVGMTEVYTYSMVSEEQLTADAKHYLKLNNPLTEDKTYLRQSLIPSLQQVMAENPVTAKQVAGVFELANVYFPGETQDTVKEELRLGVVTTLPYREARLVLEKALRQANIKARVTTNGQIVTADQVVLGQVQTLPENLIAWELKMPELVQACRPLQVHAQVNSGPVVSEDLTFVIPEGAMGEIMTKMQAVSPLIKAVHLGAVYQHNYTFGLEYQKADGALSSEELLPVRQDIVAMMAKMGYQLVGKLQEK